MNRRDSRRVLFRRPCGCKTLVYTVGGQQEEVNVVCREHESRRCPRCEAEILTPVHTCDLPEVEGLL